jgi:hypothetical protein
MPGDVRGKVRAIDMSDGQQLHVWQVDAIKRD